MAFSIEDENAFDCGMMEDEHEQENKVEDMACKPCTDDLVNMGVNCVFCGSEPKMKGQAYGKCCKADVCAAE